MTNGKTAPRFRRTRYLISARYQLKYTATILLFLFAAVAVCAYTVYYTGMVIFAEKLSNVYPQSRVVPLLAMVNYKILANILMLVPIVGLVGIYLSHKIAGPIYRVERYLSDMAAGKLTSHISFRKGDEFASLAVKINELTDSLRSTISNQRASMDKILLELDKVKKMTDSKTANVSEIDANIIRINNEIRSLERELDKFKM